MYETSVVSGSERLGGCTHTLAELGGTQVSAMQVESGGGVEVESSHAVAVTLL